MGEPFILVDLDGCRRPQIKPKTRLEDDLEIDDYTRSKIRKLFINLLKDCNSSQADIDYYIKAERSLPSFVFQLGKLDEYLLSCLSGKPNKGILKGFIRLNGYIPYFLNPLFRRVISFHGNLKTTRSSITAVRRIRQICNFFKKCDPERPIPDISTQIEIEAENKEYCEKFHKTVQDNKRFFTDLRYLCQALLFGDVCADHQGRAYVRRIRKGYFGFEPEESGRFGPGTTFEKHRTRTEKLAEYEKGFKSISAFMPTSRLFRPLSGRSLGRCTLFYKELVLSPGPLASYFLCYLYSRIRRKEYSSRGCFVPKTYFKSRFIASEPTVLSFIQQMYATCFDSRAELFKRFGLRGFSFTDQSNNMALSKKGSIDRSLSTIDLSSASDRVTFSLVSYILPELAFQQVLDCNSTYIEYKILRIPKYRVSTQGSALTFRLLGLICTAVAILSYCYTNGLPVDAKCVQYLANISVYGDDIIVPSECYNLCTYLLDLCNLKVNSEKSFSDSYFLESCGGDFFKGHCVTPIRCKSIPSFYVEGKTYSPTQRFVDSQKRVLNPLPKRLLRLVSLSRHLHSHGYSSAAFFLERLIIRYLKRFGFSLPYGRSDCGYLSFRAGVPRLKDPRAPRLGCQYDICYTKMISETNLPRPGMTKSGLRVSAIEHSQSVESRFYSATRTSLFEEPIHFDTAKYDFKLVPKKWYFVHPSDGYQHWLTLYRHGLL